MKRTFACARVAALVSLLAPALAANAQEEPQEMEEIIVLSEEEVMGCQVSGNAGVVSGEKENDLYVWVDKRSIARRIAEDLDELGAEERGTAGVSEMPKSAKDACLDRMIGELCRNEGYPGTAQGPLRRRDPGAEAGGALIGSEFQMAWMHVERQLEIGAGYYKAEIEEGWRPPRITRVELFLYRCTGDRMDPQLLHFLGTRWSLTDEEMEQLRALPAEKVERLYGFSGLEFGDLGPFPVRRKVRIGGVSLVLLSAVLSGGDTPAAREAWRFVEDSLQQGESIEQ